ncbi:hypothetical protein GCM10007171_11000 [Dickeya fangzhongdai]|nr:hypothetical protein GCM10007171_11000 [Dickeya fangzhongdai]
MVFEEVFEPFTGMIPSLSMSELNHFRRAFYPPLPVNAKPRDSLTDAPGGRLISML